MYHWKIMCSSSIHWGWGINYDLVLFLFSLALLILFQIWQDIINNWRNETGGKARKNLCIKILNLLVMINHRPNCKEKQCNEWSLLQNYNFKEKHCNELSLLHTHQSPAKQPKLLKIVYPSLSHISEEERKNTALDMTRLQRNHKLYMSSAALLKEPVVCCRRKKALNKSVKSLLWLDYNWLTWEISFKKRHLNTLLKKSEPFATPPSPTTISMSYLQARVQSGQYVTCNRKYKLYM